MLDVITIGTATRDTFLRSAAFKVLRDPKHLEGLGFKTGEAECFALGAKLEVERPVVAVGGGAANAAVTFARQGMRTAAVVRIGDDEAGAAVTKDLAKERVAVFAARDRKLGTASSIILVTPGGERTILVYPGAAEGFTRRDIPWTKLNTRWAYLVPGKMPVPLVHEIVMRLKARGASLAMNPSRAYLALGEERLRWFLERLDVVIMNREEASFLTGIPYKSESALFKRLDRLVPGIAVLTDGPRGATVSDGKYLYRAGIFKEKKLADRTGAGDAFGAGFVAGLIQKHDVTHALRLASANATSVVERMGAQAGILRKRDLGARRWRYLELDVEPL